MERLLILVIEISQSPKGAIKDAAQNQSSNAVLALEPKLVTTAASRSGIGVTLLTVTGNASGNNVVAGNRVVYGVPHRLQVSTVHSLIGLSTVVLTNAILQQLFNIILLTMQQLQVLELHYLK